MERLIAAGEIVAGEATGRALVTTEPLSFWGGLNPDTGEIIDRRHPLSGRIVSGRVLVLPHGRGSCSASGVFLEAIRNRTAPAAVIVSRLDPIIGLGAILGEELYDRTVPVVLLAPEDFAVIADGDRVEIGRPGQVRVAREDEGGQSRMVVP
jgi:predicted aconitase with swiveling domain